MTLSQLGNISGNKKPIIIASIVIGILILVGVSYGMYMKVNDKASNTASTQDEKILLQKVETPSVKTDSVAEPTISDIQATNVTQNNVVITWKTSKVMTSIVDYGIESGAYIWTTGDGTKTTNHSIQINRLSSNATYYFRVKSTEEVNGQTIEISKEGGTFKTLEASVKKIEASPKVVNTNTKQNTENTDQYAGYALYTNSLYGYEFKYKSDKWDLNTWSDPVTIITLSKKGTTDSSQRTFVEVADADVKNLDELEKKVNAQYGGTLTVKHIIVDAVPALSFTGFRNRVMVYVLKAGKVYSVDYDATLDTSYDAKSVAETFKFTERFAGYETYQNSTYGYEFKYNPKEDVAKKRSEEVVDIDFYVAPGEPTPTKRFGSQSFGSFRVEDAGSQTLESIRKERTKPGYQVENTMVGDIPAVAVTDTSFYLGDMNTFFFKGGKLYIAHFQNNVSGTATAFWESLKFTK